ncbi:MAG: calcium/sodium antiporter [Candidatus Krumholzibacteriia bacterium]
MQLLGGLVLLVVGAEVLVRGAARLAAAAGVSPLVVGLTVVAFGTSSPELAVSVKAALADQAGLAVGNVVGSNIFNVLLILGVSALVAPLLVSRQLLRLDVPVMIGASGLVWLLAADGRLGRVEGAALVLLIVAYTSFLVVQSRRETKAVQQEYAAAVPGARGRWALDLVFVAGGLVLLVVGSGWLVDGAAAVARRLGVSDLVIGLTVIAAGTSMPEAVTSVVASLRGQRDLAVGNVIGSNLFNLLAVLGLGSLVAPAGIEVSAAALRFDIPVMTAVALACLPVFFTGQVIARWEGGLFLGYYAAYTAYLVLAATSHDALPVFSRVMLLFVVPLTAVTLGVLAMRGWRARR